MSLFVASLNSGSNGNCYYVGNEQEAILIDAGISCKEIEKRLLQLNLEVQKIKAVFISHEHSDHIKGISVLSKKYQLPVYITQPTLQNGRLALQNELVQSFVANESISIGALTIIPFAKQHDAIDPYSFSILCDEVRVGVFTDIGMPCKNLIAHFHLCHAAFLESNYDEEMLEKGAYPLHLKNRIREGKGHLSNIQALALFTAHHPSFMSHLFLAHLSKNNNHPDLVMNLFQSHSKGVEIIVASRNEPTKLYEVKNPSVSRKIISTRRMVQAKLAFD
ncbi:MAG: MBL fold metallo-hydrolase [Ginsengibacter sp.]|jgi:phosphoribosyl 1,2-cyclic phosphodiesterase